MSCINCLNLKTRVFTPKNINGQLSNMTTSAARKRIDQGKDIRLVWCRQDIWDKCYVFDTALNYKLIEYRIRRVSSNDCEYFQNMEG